MRRAMKAGCTKAVLSDGNLFRFRFQRIAPAWLLVACIFAIHALIRFGGLWDTRFIALSMVMIWPLPWLLSHREGRRKMGFKAPESWRWLWIGPVIAAGVLALCAVSAWVIFGSGSANWFTQHARAMHEVVTQIPPGASAATLFWIVTVPAMIFSPFAEEFLYRGFMLTGFSEKWGHRPAMVIQATAFALVHLAHYGLRPFQPALVAVWLPSMFAAALAFGWIVNKSGSVWPAVVSHGVFNFGMNGIVFLLLPDLI